MKAYRKTSKPSFLAAAALAFALLAFPAAAGTIQDAIDAAEAGSIVRIPAGTYFEAVTLKDGITLVGAGANESTIDGGGATWVVTGARDAAIVGFTIRNGKMGVCNNRCFIGVFDCMIVDCTNSGVYIGCGSALIEGNWIEGNMQTKGIRCAGANPAIVRNALVRHYMGLMAVNQYAPTLKDNVLIGNMIGAFVADGTTLETAGNVFDDNKNHNILGQELAPTDTVGPVDWNATEIEGDGNLAAYRDKMDAVFAEKIAQHPVVEYDLWDEAGSFGVTTRFPWATFFVSVATTDTAILAYDAHDVVTEQPLYAEYREQALPTVAVVNKDLVEKIADRYVLDTVYEHDASYHELEDGRRVFKRLTTLSLIEIVLPAGFLPAAINLPADFEWVGERLVVKITDVGSTQIEMTMDRIAPGVADPFGVLGLK